MEGGGLSIRESSSSQSMCYLGSCRTIWNTDSTFGGEGFTWGLHGVVWIMQLLDFLSETHNTHGACGPSFENGVAGATSEWQ